MKYFLLILVALSGCWAQVARFDNYKVFRMNPKTNQQLQLISELFKNNQEYDFWKGPSHINIPIDIMVPPHKIADFYEIINKIHINTTQIIEDVQKLIDNNNPKTKANGPFGWTQYYRKAEIDAWLVSLEETYPDKVQVIVGGRSYEGRNITGVKVSFKPGNKIVFIEAGIHAREWISPATVTYILNELLTSQDPDVREIAESYDWHIFPITNPDGYEYTHTQNRLWRKTRKPNGFCVGADPNRNWDYMWMEGGADDFPCSELYAGSAPFSEVETKTLSEYITSIHENLVAYLDFHSYSQLLMYPYGQKNMYAENRDELHDIANKASQSIARRYKTAYEIGSIADVVYVATGSSVDWVKGVHNIPITFAFELRPDRYSGNGFVLPPSQIIPTGEETLDGVITIMKEAKSNGH